uniref:C1q domain-containing protein n=1 Tax=Gadus morhua TaxID=8049 RepID=A0A8C5B4T5_GADMO
RLAHLNSGILSESLIALGHQPGSRTLAAVPRMAFTAALGHSLGPVHIDLTVKYPLIISNIGNGYNPATGIFTARVSGMYYFRYTMFNNLGSRSNSVMSLMKNSQRMVSTWDTSGSDDNDTATNAAVLQLEEGDNVYTRLYANRQIYDDGANYNTFSGFLAKIRTPPGTPMPAWPSASPISAYQVIISNMGNGYNPATGIFTARVSGMYYFSYTMYNNNRGSTPNSEMSLMKNGQLMAYTSDIVGNDFQNSATNAAVLRLEAGDNVYTELYANRRIYDDGANYNTFSGFLLFPLNLCSL